MTDESMVDVSRGRKEMLIQRLQPHREYSITILPGEITFYPLKNVIYSFWLARDTSKS